MDIDQVREICRDKGIHTVECSFPDSSGLPRGKRMPARYFLERGYEGFDLANASLIWTRKNEVYDDVAYTNWGTGYPDMRAVPDLSTFRSIPWRPGAASVLCDCLEEDGTDVMVSTRTILKNVAAEAHAMGYDPKVGSELEFYIMDAQGVPLYQELDCYGITRGATMEHLLERVRRELDDFGIEVEACNPEYGPAQVEVNVRYGSALQTADDTMLFKAGVKEIAAQLGYRVTFMAKPFADQSGSGYHVHQSLTDVETGQPLFATAGHHLNGAPPVMGFYLAGLLANMAAFTAFGAPTINAYKRVSDYTFAPVNVCWGVDNRTVGVRAIIGHGPANRLEYRNAAADANPYVLIAACLAGGLDGIRQGLELPPMVEGDAYSRPDLAPLPRTFEEALHSLESHELAHKVFGEYLQVFLVQGRHEIEQWRSVITDWERTRYFDV